MRIFLFALLTMLSFNASALKLSYVGETLFKTGTKFEKTTIGGLSGIFYEDRTLYALSDDKGRAGKPRFYEFELTIKNKKVSLAPKAVRFITGLPKIGDKEVGLDPEGLVRLPDGSFLISSEGNNDSKPRVMPRIFQVSAGGEWKRDLPVLGKYLPEFTGKQTVGIQGNAAFEGLTSTSGGKFIFTAIESALLQDYSESEWDKGDHIRIFKYQKENSYKPSQEYFYRIDAFQTEMTSKEVFRGVSEILSLSENKMLVLERGIRLSINKIYNNTVALYLADLSKGTDVSAQEKIGDAPFTAVEKIELLDFETDLTKERVGKVVQNFEALAWGPTLSDGRRTLLVMSDNNFSKAEITELVVFAVDEE